MGPRPVSLNASLRLVQLAIVASWMNVAFPIFTAFYLHEIGMTLTQVGQLQAAYTIVVLFVNLPTGRLADRYGRKLCTVIGFLVMAAGFLIYAAADSFLMVLLAECVLGIGIATSEGSDAALLESICVRLDRSFDDVNRHTVNWQTVCEIVAVGAGGYIGIRHPRVAMLLSAGFVLLAAVTTMAATDPVGRQVSQPKAKQSLQGWVLTLPVRTKATIEAITVNSQLAWWVIAWGISQRIPQAVLWFLTPLLSAVGASALVLGLSWMGFMAASWLGSYLVRPLDVYLAKRGYTLGASGRYGVCIGLVAVPTVALGVDVNVLSVALFACFGLLRGWQCATIKPAVLARAPEALKSTSLGTAGLIGDALYVPGVTFVGWASDISLHWGMLAIAPYLVLMLVAWRKLRHPA